MLCPACQTEVAPSSPGLTPLAHCSHCGASLLTDAEHPGADSVDPVATSSGLADNTAAALAYITFLPAILFLRSEPYKRIPLVRFHSIQSIGLFLLWCLARYIVVLQPWSHELLIQSLLDGLVLLLFFIVWLVCVLKAMKGEFFKLPILGNIAQRQSGS